MKEGLPSPISNKERRKLVRQPSQPPPKDGKFRLDRRHVISGAAGLVVIAGGVVLRADLLAGKKAEDQIFTGDVEETKNYISQWDNSFKEHPEKFGEYLPKIVNVAVAYFTKQMSMMFPDRQTDYDKKRFENKILILGTAEFVEKQKAAYCGTTTSDTKGFSDPVTRKVYVNKDSFVQDGYRLDPSLVFGIILHELHHFSPPIRRKVMDSAGVKTVQYEQGFNTLVYRLEASGEECFLSASNKTLEEAIVEDSTEHLMSRLGIPFAVEHYAVLVDTYEKSIIQLLYNGEEESGYRELLGYHQKSDLRGFLGAVGRRQDKGSNRSVDEQVKDAEIIIYVLFPNA